MPTVFVTEYAGSPTAPLPQFPLATHEVTIGAWETFTPLLNPKCGFVRVFADAACRFAVGATGALKMPLGVEQFDYQAIPRSAGSRVYVQAR